MKIKAASLIPAVGLALLLMNQGSVARAGFVSDSLAIVQGELSLPPGEGGAGPAPADSNDALSPLNLLSDREATPSRHVGMVNFPGGMSAPTPDSTGVTSSVVAVVVPVTEIDARMVVWLGREGRKWLPPPFSTGVFRPPRVTG